MPVTAPILHSDAVPLARLVGENISLAKEVGLSADADVGGSNTTTTMKAAIDTASLTKHADVSGFKPGLKRAYDYGLADGVMSDANVQAASALTDLVGVSGADSNKRGPIAVE